MEKQERPEITPENKDQELKLKAGEFAFADKYGTIHTAGDYEELMRKIEALKEE